MNLNILKIAASFAGCFLGAGYVSGQELYQFFISFGIYGILGLLLAILLLFTFGVMLIRLAYKTQKSSAEDIIIRCDNSFLKAFVGVSEIFFLVGIAVIMAAGVGALFEQLIGFSKYISSALFCVVLFFLIIGGHDRMVSFFSLSVPVLVVMTVIISVVSIIHFDGFSSIPATFEKASSAGTDNIFLSNWFVSALTFVSYNLFSSAEILTPLGNTISSKKRTYIGIGLGTLFLFVIAISIFFAVSSNSVSFESELPMLYIAETISPILGYIYAVLLLLGMIGTAFSSCVATVHYVTSKHTTRRLGSYISAAIVCMIVFCGSLFGFGELIGILYPVCGYFGIAVIILIAEHAHHLKKEK